MAGWGVFSRAGLLTDPNMDPQFLVTLTSIAASKAAYKPSYEEIKAKYFEKFRGKGGEGEAGPSSLACANEDRMLFAPIAFDDLPLRTTPSPEALMFSRSPSPTVPLSPPYYSK